MLGRDEVTLAASGERMRVSLEDDGFEVAVVHGMGLVDNAAIGRCEP